MKITVSIPDPTFRKAERLARRLKKSRSRLYAEAMAANLCRYDLDAVTAALNRVWAKAEDRTEPFGDCCRTSSGSRRAHDIPL